MMMEMMMLVMEMMMIMVVMMMMTMITASYTQHNQLTYFRWQIQQGAVFLSVDAQGGAEQWVELPENFSRFVSGVVTQLVLLLRVVMVLGSLAEACKVNES